LIENYPPTKLLIREAGSNLSPLSGCKVARETAIVKKKEKKYEEDQRPETKMNGQASRIRSPGFGSCI
jgi:hypothetical protein